MEQETSISFVLFLLVSSYQPTLQLLGAARELPKHAACPRWAFTQGIQNAPFLVWIPRELCAWHQNEYPNAWVDPLQKTNF